MCSLSSSRQNAGGDNPRTAEGMSSLPLHLRINPKRVSSRRIRPSALSGALKFCLLSVYSPLQKAVRLRTRMKRCAVVAPRGSGPRLRVPSARHTANLPPRLQPYAAETALASAEPPRISIGPLVGASVSQKAYAVIPVVVSTSTGDACSSQRQVDAAGS